MGWVKEALKELNTKGTCAIRPHGGSMKGRIESGQLVILKKIDTTDLYENDVALVKWKGNYLLHLVLEISDEEVLIGNNIGKVNGWIPTSHVIAKVIQVE